MNLPNEIYIVFIGLSLIGFAVGVSTVPTFPEIYEPILLRFRIPLEPEKDKNGRDLPPHPALGKICDKASFLLNFIMMFPGATSPILGGWVFD